MEPNSNSNISIENQNQPQSTNYSQPENRITYPEELKTPSSTEKIIKIALIVLGTIIIVYTGVVVYQTQLAHKQADEPVPSPLPTKIPTPTTLEVLGNQLNWVYFNQNYQSPYRKFRFKYPDIFEIRDWESSNVWLMKDNRDYLGIDQEYYLDLFDGRSPEEQIAYYYEIKKQQNPKNPNLSQGKKIELEENILLYKFTDKEEKTTPGQTIGGYDTWIHYEGIVDGKGIDVYNIQNLSEELVLEIIKTIDFK